MSWRVRAGLPSSPASLVNSRRSDAAAPCASRSHAVAIACSVIEGSLHVVLDPRSRQRACLRPLHADGAMSLQSERRIDWIRVAQRRLPMHCRVEHGVSRPVARASRSHRRSRRSTLGCRVIASGRGRLPDVRSLELGSAGDAESTGSRRALLLRDRYRSAAVTQLHVSLTSADMPLDARCNATLAEPGKA